MAQKKYLDSVGLSRFLENIKSKFSEKNHTHTKSQITDFAHTHDDRYYTEPEIDEKVSALTDAISNSADTKVTQTAITDTSSYTDWRSLPIGLDSDTNEDTDPTTVTGNLYTTGNIKAQPSTGTIKATTFKGNLEGNAVTSSLADNAKKLSTPRKLMTKLDAADAASFDGSADVKTIGVTGKLPIVNGGTGADSISGFKTNIGLNPVTTSGTGAAYTADVNGITSLKAGVNFVMIPHTVSTQRNPTLNVNGLGAKLLKMRLSSYTSATTSFKAANSLAANKPVRVMYDGAQWVIDGYVYPDAKGLYGAVPVSSGGTGATTAEEARKNLGITTANGTMLSQNVDYAEVGEWADDNPSDEDRIGYFVAIDNSSAGATMVKATSTSDVRGVTVTSPAFSGNCSDDKFDIVTSDATDPDTGETITKITSKKLKKQYDYVAVMGIVSVIDNGTCEINGRCMPTEDGTAVPSPNNMGYQIIDRIDDTHVLIAVSPEADMMVRIRTDVVDLQKNKADASHNHDGRYYTESEIDSKVASINSAIADKASSSHTHDDRYYTESEINSKLATKVNSSTFTSHSGDTTVHITAAERDAWNTAKTHADSPHAPSNAEANQNAFSNVKVGDTTIAADSKTDTLTIVAGSNVTITPDATNDAVTIAAKDTTYSDVTTSAHGLMSAADKTKLDTVATGANKTVVDSALSSTSTNPVQNMVINSAIADKVPNVRTVNGKSLAANISLTAADVGASAAGHTHDDRYYTESEMNSKLAGKANSSHTHAATDITSVNASAITGIIPAANLPSFVDDVIEGYLSGSKLYKTKNSDGTYATEISGETGKIYVNLNDNKTYRWSGSAFVVISETIALGETSSTAYRGDRGKVAYDHSQKTGNPHGTTKADLGLGSVENKSSATIRGELTKANVTTALGYTPPTTNTTYSVGSTTNLGLTKLYTGTGSKTDGTMTQSAITTALNGKANSSHTHNYAGSDGAGGSANQVKNWGSVAANVNVGRHIWISDSSEDMKRVSDDNFTYNSSTNTVTANITGNAATASAVAWSNVTSKPNRAGSSSDGGSATSAVKLDTSAGSTTQPVYFSGGKPVAIPYTLGKSVPSDAKFTDTTYGTGSSTTAGLTKLYTGTGSATDGTMTQNAITTALNGKANNHSHPYLPTDGGTMSGNIAFAAIGDKAKAAGLSWSGSTDGASIYYETRAADEGHLVLNMVNDSNVTIDIAAGGAVKSYFDYGGTFHGSVVGNASSASSVPWSGITGKPNLMQSKSENGYWGMANPDGTNSDWISTSNNGLIPYKSGGASSLGTDSWPFANAYISNIHGSLDGNAKTATTASSANSVPWSGVTGKPSSMPASDVYSWAKQSSKPRYSVNVSVDSNGNATFSVS